MALVLTSICGYQTVRAADHIDGPRASADPSADITDVFTWMTPDATKVIIAIDLTRNATTGSKFSDAVVYATRTRSSATFGGAAAEPIDVVCTFNAAQQVQCWVGDDAYVSGDARGPAGITSDDGRVRVFTGLRQDPFFFNLAGFRETCRIVAGAASGLTFDAAGCPALDEATATALVTQLQSAPGGGPAPDSFATFNVIAIVNAASGTCAQYLAVEANAVGVTNDDCGGRTPLEDSIDTTYSLLAAGALSGVGDGVPIDADSTASLTAFPYLDDPS